MSHDPNRPFVDALEEIQKIAKDALPLAQCYDERGELLLRLAHERNELHGYVNGLLGLLQMVRRRDDMPAAIREALNTNHRVTDAAAYLTQILPPEHHSRKGRREAARSCSHAPPLTSGSNR